MSCHRILISTRNSCLSSPGASGNPQGSVLYPAEFVIGDLVSAFGGTVSNFIAFAFQRHRLEWIRWLLPGNSWRLNNGLTKSKLRAVSGIRMK